MSIHQGHLQLILKIRYGAEPLDYCLGAALFRIIYQQSFKGANGDIFKMRADIFQHFHALIQAEQRLLCAIDHYRYRNAAKHLRRPLDDIDMAVRHRVETAGNNRVWHGRLAYSNKIESKTPTLQ